MPRRSRGDRRSILAAALLSAALAVSGCTTEEIAGSTVGATILGANSPSQEIQQIYYLGAFDPQGQLPPTVYRIRVHGQASFISFVRFASGWGLAKFIHSLASDAGFGEGRQGSVEFDQGSSEPMIPT